MIGTKIIYTLEYGDEKYTETVLDKVLVEHRIEIRSGLGGSTTSIAIHKYLVIDENDKTNLVNPKNIKSIKRPN